MRLGWVREDQFRKQVHAFAHDFRAPLRVALQVMERLEEDGTVDEQERFLLRRSIRLLEMMIHNLEDDAQLFAGRLPLQMEELQLSPYLRELCQDFSYIADKSGVALCLEIQCDGAVVRCDQGKLMRSLCNLFFNALRYTPEGGEIRIVATAGKQVSICVHDNGSGMEAAQVKRIRRALRRYSLGRYPLWGESYGLSLVGAFTYKMNGRVEVQSARGQGTHVTMHFPLRG